MTHILLYLPPPYKDSGGLGNFKLFFDICKGLGYSIYFCPLFKNIPSIGFLTQFNDRNINTITHAELINYYQCPSRPSEFINSCDIVTPSILQARNNIVIYCEDVMGNPSEQQYIVRWLFYFPVPSVLPHYNFNSDYICFYSDYIFNFYKFVCLSCGFPDFLTKNIKQLNICRVFKFQPNIYNSLPKRIINSNIKTNRKCFTVRKCFPPVSFSSYNKNINFEYYRDIQLRYIKSIKILKQKIKTATMFDKRIINNKLIGLKKNPPNIKSFETITNYLKNKFLNMNYDNIEAKNSSIEYINYFQTKDFYLTFDPFTFLSIIASLCGCISVIKKIPGLGFEEWRNGDPFNKYGIAYGQEGIQHALETQPLLFNHINNMYKQNETNIRNFINNIESHFNIKINNINKI